MVGRQLTSNSAMAQNAALDRLGQWRYSVRAKFRSQPYFSALRPCDDNFFGRTLDSRGLDQEAIQFLNTLSLRTGQARHLECRKIAITLIDRVSGIVVGVIA